MWSPSHSYLQSKIERVQRRATRWIMRSRIGEMSCKERLIRSDLLPLVYDRELTCMDKHDFVSFVTHGRTRLSNSFNLKTPICKTSAFQASYFKGIVKLWNFTCKSVPESSLSSIAVFKNFLKQTLTRLLRTAFDVERPCTYVRSCACHRSSAHRM